MLERRRGKRRTLHALRQCRSLDDALRQLVETFADDVLFEAQIHLGLKGLEVSLREILRLNKVVELRGHKYLHFHELILQFFALFALNRGRQEVETLASKELGDEHFF